MQLPPLGLWSRNPDLPGGAAGGWVLGPRGWEEVPGGPGARIFQEGHWAEAAGVFGTLCVRPSKRCKGLGAGSSSRSPLGPLHWHRRHRAGKASAESQHRKGERVGAEGSCLVTAPGPCKKKS